jgi:hypothetical protein
MAEYDSGGCRASSVALKDINGDGKLDLLVVNEFATNRRTTDLLAARPTGPCHDEAQPQPVDLAQTETPI